MCSSLCSADERIFIFGKSSHNFAEIIKAALNIDVDCYVYDTNNNLFVCKTSNKSSEGIGNTLSPVLLFFGSQPLLAGEDPLSHVLSSIQNAGPSYRVFRNVNTTQDFLPPLTSTPSRFLINLKESHSHMVDL